jgi:hypothetical protein
MSYSRNFGFRSFENIVRNGRFRAPATGTPILIGAPVIIDTATPGYLKPATAGAALGLGGIALFEHIQKKGVDLDLVGTADFASVPLGQYTQIVHGPGTKVWFKNTAAKTLYDGRVIPAAALVPASGIAVGDGLTPDGAGKFKKATVGTDPVWLVIEQINATTGLVEARLTF